MTSDQINRIRGVVFGQAIGDALGLGTEFMNKQQIDDYYYPHGLTDYKQIVQTDHTSRWEIGDWTDDTDQALCIMDSIIETNTVNERAFADHLMKWFNYKPMDIGMTVIQSLRNPLFTSSPIEVSKKNWELSNMDNASNGGVMRTSVLGIWDFFEPTKVRQNTELICKTTHYDPRCVGSCVIVTEIISRLVRDGSYPTVEEIKQLGKIYDERIIEFINLAHENKDITKLELDEPHSIGYTLKALSAGLWAFFHATSFEQGMLAVIAEGGDADTNAAVACSLMGAKFGFNAIPEKYVSGLLHEDILRTKVNILISKIGQMSKA